MKQVQQDIWIAGAERCPSPNFSERKCQPSAINGYVDLLVIHNISLPPARTESDFYNRCVEEFFCNKLDTEVYPTLKELDGICVSAHLYIRRDGSIVQFVPLNKSAWHAGVSQHKGREACNDFSVGIELQGTDVLPYTERQYHTLIQVTQTIREIFTKITVENIVGHVHIAPDRKTDPGASFDWQKYKTELVQTETKSNL
ncbi:1,6-anhydro-N-acetylmuramyl-L-alanine amidase AmpD [Psychrosphaera sp. B3R10]|uniref:1,6-anhydro-N-acetylmuramyl-L-alanine amidase AmpD n=1 Tax=unclassified Psychrosphaera TaxID=2641570 RepID=UPI001C07F6FE|nr:MULTISPECIES: 1,6-anhydro-N-acetylmuramyl-L-alanine amidase AmpD [unclassified Psychrosphaera]MBU2882529.1 1,6-anhydro-N-acetylmuramyl-L-alanine amidase AmpD [Psychrosphaera sp. I2R16]MBU2989453.1 1,6-anhydro-N-acetylmuramyl-L-alanine amidase AmpD [Psychrosphaera sp. B3R10]